MCNIDCTYSKYKGISSFKQRNKFRVKLIFNKLSPLKTINEVYNTCYKLEKVKYKKDEFVQSLRIFDENVHKKCSSGIHYYKKINGAYYHETPKSISDAYYHETPKSILDERYSVNFENICESEHGCESGGKCLLL